MKEIVTHSMFIAACRVLVVHTVIYTLDRLFRRNTDWKDYRKRMLWTWLVSMIAAFSAGYVGVRFGL